jgi:hypothetical protein
MRLQPLGVQPPVDHIGVGLAVMAGGPELHEPVEVDPAAQSARPVAGGKPSRHELLILHRVPVG